jgi:hypothetical protein
MFGFVGKIIIKIIIKYSGTLGTRATASNVMAFALAAVGRAPSRT